jgi:hypothetical protein
VLLIAADAAWNQDGRSIGLDPKTGKARHAHLLGSTKLKARSGAHVHGLVKPTVTGNRVLRLIGLTAPAKLAVVQFTLSDGHGRHASRSVTVH